MVTNPNPVQDIMMSVVHILAYMGEIKKKYKALVRKTSRKDIIL